jgi:hypothetical protein
VSTENSDTSTDVTTGDERMEDLASRGDSRSQRPDSAAFREFIASGWDETVPDAERRESADFTPERRDALVRRLPGTRLVLPAGVLKVRSNDTDYPFRPDSAFAYYSGLGTDEEPDSVLVVEPSAEDPTLSVATYFFRPRAGFDSSEFYADARYGEMWVGRRPTVAEAAQRLGIEVRHIDELRDHLAKDVGAQLSLTVVAAGGAGGAALGPGWTRASRRWSRRSGSRTDCRAGTRPPPSPPRSRRPRARPAWSRTSTRCARCASRSTRPCAASRTSSARSPAPSAIPAVSA